MFKNQPGYKWKASAMHLQPRVGLCISINHTIPYHKTLIFTILFLHFLSHRKPYIRTLKIMFRMQNLKKYCDWDCLGFSSSAQQQRATQVCPIHFSLLPNCSPFRIEQEEKLFERKKFLELSRFASVKF